MPSLGIDIVLMKWVGADAAKLLRTKMSAGGCLNLLSIWMLNGIGVKVFSRTLSIRDCIASIHTLAAIVTDTSIDYLAPIHRVLDSYRSKYRTP